MASSSSIGVEVGYGEDQTLKVRELAAFDFDGIDIVLSSPGAKVSAEHSPRAAKAGAVVIDNTSHFRMHPDVPLVLMGYANPMVRRGPEWFAQEAAGAGVDGVICVDIPPEEDSALGPALRERGIAPIRLATPTTDDFRLPTVIEGSEGFLYYVSVAGITGKQSAAQDSIDAAVKRLKAATDLPVAVGFGVRTPEQAGAIAKVADGVVVGSALVDLVAEHGADAPAHLRDLTARLAKAVHSAERAAA